MPNFIPCPLAEEIPVFPQCHSVKGFVIASQSADWRGNPSLFNVLDTDSHGSDIGHCLGMTGFSQLDDIAYSPPRRGGEQKDLCPAAILYLTFINYDCSI